MDEKEKREAKERFVNYMSNPRAFTVKRWLYELLKEKFGPHEKISERLAVALQTDQDVEEFGRLITEIFECGFRKAVEDYKAEAEKLGLKVHVVPGNPS